MSVWMCWLYPTVWRSDSHCTSKYFGEGSFPVLPVCPSVGGGRKMTAILLPRGQGGWTEPAFFISEARFHFFSLFVFIMCSLVMFFCSIFPPLLVDNEFPLCVEKGSRSFKWQASSFACLVCGRNPTTVHETQFPICSDIISPPDAKVADYILNKCFVSGNRLETKRFRFGLGCSRCWNAVKCSSLSSARVSSRHSSSHPASPAALLSVCVDH